MGANKIDILTANLPDLFLQHPYNRFQKFAISFFSRTEAGAKESASDSNAVKVFKVPFTVSKSEVLGVSKVDPRLAGWGVLFSGVTLSALALFLVTNPWKKNGALFLVLLMVLGTSILNPEFWWARYAPQISLLPVLLLLPSLLAASRLYRRLAYVVCGLILINNLLFVAGSGAIGYVMKTRINRDFAFVAQTGGPGEYWEFGKPHSPGRYHFEQFSGNHGIIICGQIDPQWSSPPAGGFLLSLSRDNAPLVSLYKGSCSAQPLQK